MKTAIYARYSSELQRETSIDDQIAVAKRYAIDRDWKVLKDHVYTDSALSGSSIQSRPAIQRLLAAAATHPRPFDVLLVDDSSRIARDIPDAIRAMQTLKFLGIRVIYISQGIDSASDQADALVTVHGLIDSLYLKELAKKIKRGQRGQLDRGFSTGAVSYGYRKFPVIDPSGKKDDHGNPMLLGKRIEIHPEEATVVRQIFEWAAEGWGASRIVEHLNRHGVVGSGGKRWTKSPLSRVLANERYLGKQIWGQQSVQHEPGTGRKFMRNNAREEWEVRDRPDLRIVSDDLWARTQSTRAAVRESVAPKRNLARGKDARFHSAHLFTGFARCAICDGSMTSVSGGSGSPRWGCARSWREGVSACPNRLTIRMKVAEPQILARLGEELLKPPAVAHITRSVQKAVALAESVPSEREGTVRRQLEQERKKLQNLVTAIEGGSDAPAALLKAVAEREAAIKRLNAELTKSGKKAPRPQAPDLTTWVRDQLENLTDLLKRDPRKVKSEFRRLNLALSFAPTEAAPRPYFMVKGQCDLSALVFLFVRRRAPQSAALDRLLGKAGRGRNCSRARCTR